jgi:serine protease Do
VLRGLQEWAALLENGPWDGFGLKLEPVGANVVAKAHPSLKGGLRVVAVRPDSPAGAQKLQPGDVLVGLHQWETLTQDNVRFVLDHCRKAGMGTVSFYLVRGNQVLRGQFDVPR